MNKKFNKTVKVNEANKYTSMFASLDSYQAIETKYKEESGKVDPADKQALDSAYQEATASVVGEAVVENKSFLKGDEAKKIAESILAVNESAPFGTDKEKVAGFYNEGEKVMVFDNTGNQMIMEEVATIDEASAWLKGRGISEEAEPEKDKDDPDGKEVNKPDAVTESIYESYKGKPLPMFEEFSKEFLDAQKGKKDDGDKPKDDDKPDDKPKDGDKPKDDDKKDGKPF